MAAHSVAGAVSHPWARLSLVVRVMLSASLAMVVAGVLLLWVSTGKDAELARTEIEEHLVTEMDSLLPAISDWAVIGDFANIEQMLRLRVKRTDIQRITWTSAHGKTLEAVDKAVAPHAPVWFERWIGVPSPRAIRALSIGGRDYGQVTIEMTATPIHNWLWEAFLSNLAILALGLALNFTGILLVLRHGLRPLSALDQGASALERGDLSARIPLQGSPELQHPITAFNRMAESLQKSLEEQKQTEDQLRRMNETLERRVAEGTAKNMEQERLLIQQSRLAAMGEMIGNIAHQWRQPINALTLILANIKDAYDYNDLTKEYLYDGVKTGQNLIQKMSHTIDDFRNFFRPNKEKEGFHACNGVEEAINMVNDSFKSSNIDIAFDRPDEPCNVVGYPNEFAQVVLNVLTNAKEAIIGKKVGGQVHIRVEHGADTITIVILDNGGGIPQEILPKVFDPYFTTKEKGTGIGLYMSKMIMDNMGGDIVIRNIEGGAKVMLTLPLANPAV